MDMANDNSNLIPVPATVPEALLIEQLNITAKKMARLRPAGVTQDASGVCWPLADAQALAASLQAVLSLPAEKKAAAAQPEPEELTVISTAKGTDGRHFANPNVIQCQRASGQLVTVRVVHSGKYRPRLRLNGEPMTLRATPALGGNWWVLVGREPRFIAQW